MGTLPKGAHSQIVNQRLIFFSLGDELTMSRNKMDTGNHEPITEVVP